MQKTSLKTRLIHPYPIEREALSAWFRQQSMIELTGELRELPERYCPSFEKADLVIVFDHGIEKLPARITCLRKAHPDLRLIIFRAGRSVSDIRDLIYAGVNAILDITSDTDEWYSAIRAIEKGQVFFDQHIMQNLAGLPVIRHNSIQIAETERILSIREKEILALVAREYSTSRIASELFISIKTVETHRRNLFQKLQVKNVVGLTKAALRMGVLG
ncbi:DNA-binding response regulator, NarL/FixJ family, contains REC and HTH domains [Dyadobacter sp. SG02]|uniref:response regulator transcription factor n=1 Tax=Dyadobacter sp. SG02 TaxID=1855291 RepID=UPI0008D53F1C|nr:response regulator transcription factor [Dyadobacter sp. SG02]SEJ66172.1 DNA-binding response regulator, NarL/FixJ family, contains REC and HTH domains [Dyadobacter sp. SG02]